MKEIQKVVELLKLNQPTPKSMDEARQKHYQFWDTQPVPKLGIVSNGIKFMCVFDVLSPVRIEIRNTIGPLHTMGQMAIEQHDQSQLEGRVFMCHLCKLVSHLRLCMISLLLVVVYTYIVLLIKQATCKVT